MEYFLTNFINIKHKHDRRHKGMLRLPCLRLQCLSLTLSARFYASLSARENVEHVRIPCSGNGSITLEYELHSALHTHTAHYKPEP